MIHSFEPTPDLSEKIKREFYNDKNVKINNCGVAEKKGFLSKNEKLEMINIVTSLHKKIHKDKTTYYEYKEEVLSGTRDLFPNCLP